MTLRFCRARINIEKYIGLSSRQGVIPDRRYSPQPALAVESGVIPGADSIVWYIEAHQGLHSLVVNGRRTYASLFIFLTLKKATSNGG